MILVTGATGTIGSSTVKALKARGARFKVASRSPEKLQGSGVEAVLFDWDKLETYGSALQGVEKLFVLTPTTEKQAEYTQRLVDAAKKSGVKHIVKLSVMGADAEPGIMLGRLHKAGENAIKASGIAWTMLRPTFFMENFINFYGADPKKDSTVYLPHGQGKAAWVDGRDIGEVAAVVMTTPGHEGKTYDLTGPEALGAQEALDALGQAVGHKYTYVDVPEAAAQKAMTDMGASKWSVDGLMELNFIIKQGWSAALGTGVKDVLGRPPRSFSQYAKDFASGQR
ncbi:SDR family oxidoreductase [Hyalangium rubrum]|uniref:SDR family oxidoreductase n=1 Tax=Hyalangium rubrum TaxID=3103134 RepID=A0ABU5GX60_9BACT|nr:SDR family oxidoreductase [Hyalangium sp. s54d21]MDY7225616.1 SDR family oxidoreductase [Hyalangium sp. s54d21]